jgi:hypothetical protein
MQAVAGITFLLVNFLNLAWSAVLLIMEISLGIGTMKPALQL